MVFVTKGRRAGDAAAMSRTEGFFEDLVEFADWVLCACLHGVVLRYVSIFPHPADTSSGIFTFSFYVIFTHDPHDLKKLVLCENQRMLGVKMRPKTAHPGQSKCRMRCQRLNWWPARVLRDYRHKLRLFRFSFHRVLSSPSVGAFYVFPNP